MWKVIFPLFISISLVACAPTGSDDPFENPGADDGSGEGGDGTTINVPEAIAQNLVSFDFADDQSTLTLEMKLLDTTPVEAVYTREPALDIPGYLAYSVQEDPLDRYFVALAGESADGTVRAVVVGDGGQFNRVFRGAGYERDGGFNPPSTSDAPGLVTYVGDYAGVTNIRDVNGRQLQPIGASGGGINAPGQPWLVEGKVFVNVDFADNGINGQIYERVLIPASDGFVRTDMEDLTLIPGDLDEDGTFQGEVENPGIEFEGIGVYAGIVGGPNAENIAGGVDIASPVGTSPDYLETGVFVLGRCGTDATADPLCDIVEPTP